MEDASGIVVDYDAIRQVLDEVVSLANAHGASPTKPSNQHIRQLIEILKQHEYLNGTVQIGVRSLGGWTGINPDALAWMMMRQSIANRENGGAIAWLKAFLGTERAVGHSVRALWGVRVDTRIRIDEQVELLPISDLPSSQLTRSIDLADTIDLAENFPRHIPHFPPMHLGNRAPQAALAADVVLQPVIIKTPPTEADHEGNLRRHEKIRATLHSAQMGLSVALGSACLGAGSWFQYADEHLDCDVLTNPSISWSPVGPSQMAVPRETNVNPDDVRKYVAGFRRLDATAQKRLEFVLDRLQEANRPNSPAESAVAVCTALESLLVNAPGEHTFKVALRSAILLGESLDDRQRIRNYVSAVYKLRSGFVHHGQRKNIIKVGPTECRASDAVSETRKMCAEIVRRIVSDRAFPDWQKLDVWNAPHQ